MMIIIIIDIISLSSFENRPEQTTRMPFHMTNVFFTYLDILQITSNERHCCTMQSMQMTQYDI